MKILCSLCIVLFVVEHEANAFNYYDDYNSQLWLLAQKKGEDVNTYARKTVFDILKSIISDEPLKTLRRNYGTDISPALESMFKAKSYVDIYNSYPGFKSLRVGSTLYNVSMMMFVVGASQFDSVATTNNIMVSLSSLTGNASIAPALKTTDAKLQKRRFLTDIYPVLLANIDLVMDETRPSFFLNSLRLSEKDFRSVVKNDTAVDALLSARKRMAIAGIKSSIEDTQSASMDLQRAMTAASQVFLKASSRIAFLGGMPLMEIKSKCSLSLNDVKMRTLLQISLRCTGLPENFPIKPTGFPIEAFNITVMDMAKALKMDIDDYMKYSPEELLKKYVEGTRNEAFVNAPLYYLSMQKGIRVTILQNRTLSEIASMLVGLNKTMLKSTLSTSEAALDVMSNTTLGALPVAAQNSVSVDFPQMHFYFMSFSSIATMLDKRANKSSREAASRDASIIVNKRSIHEVSQLLGLSKLQVKQMPLLRLFGKAAGKDEQAVFDSLHLRQQDKVFLRSLNLAGVEETHHLFGYGDLVLSWGSLSTIASDPWNQLLLSKVNRLLRLFGKADALNFTLHELVSRNTIFENKIKIAAWKMKINDFMIRRLPLTELMFAFNKTLSDVVDRPFFNLLKDLRTLSRSKIPASDFGISISVLSANKGLPLSSLEGKSISDMIRSVTRSAWQLPLVLSSSKAHPDLMKALRQPSLGLQKVVQNIILDYKSYEFTINRLLDILLGLDDVSHTEEAIRLLAGFLSEKIGVKSMESLGIDTKAISDKPFLTFALPVMSKALQNLSKDVYVDQYFENVHHMRPKMVGLLQSKTDGDIGEKLAQAALNWLDYDQIEALNVIFDVRDVYWKFGKRFVEMPFERILGPCNLTEKQLKMSTAKFLLKTCMNTSSEEYLRRSLNVSKLVMPLVEDISLEEIGRIVDKQIFRHGSSLSSLLNRKTQQDIGILVAPLNDVFKRTNFGVQSGRKLSLLDLFKSALFSQFNSMRFLLRSMAFGKSLDVLNERPIDDLIKAIGVDDKELSRTSPYDVLSKTLALIKRDPRKCMKLNRMPNLCHKHASCISTGDTFNCRCKSGYSGDGFKNCTDQCAVMKCAKDSVCVNLPTKGALCRCNDRWSKFKSGKCERIRGLIIKVAKLRLKQEYKKEYADVNSNAFKRKAAEIEDALFSSVCVKIGCKSVIVSSIQQGSLIVDFNVIFASDNISTSAVQDAVDVAMKGREMAALNPDTTTKIQASRSNECQSGMAKCGSNEECIPANKGYTCSCISGYQKKGDVCQKSGSLSFVIVIVIILVVFVLVVSLIVFAIWRWKRSRNSHSSKYTMAYLSNDETEAVQLATSEHYG